MGATWVTRHELTSVFGDALGYKSGLVLSYQQMLDLVDDKRKKYWTIGEGSIVRIRSEEIDDMFAGMLYRLGISTQPDSTPHMLRLFKKYHDTPDRELYEKVGKLWVDFLAQEVKERRDGAPTEQTASIDPSPAVNDCLEKFGARGLQILIEAMEGLNEDLARSFWGKIRRVEWKDARTLDELFKSEKLESLHGHFFDQRFINYLAASFDSIDAIHWRQFEGLTCEFFERQGFTVSIGEGRDDGNIDARVWPKGQDPATPPAILVQCKRQKEKVGKMVVKALYADILDAQATSGLIVTSSELQPGAEAVCIARAYPITQVKRETLHEWLVNMRTPLSGIFMGT